MNRLGPELQIAVHDRVLRVAPGLALEGVAEGSLAEALAALRVPEGGPGLEIREQYAARGSAIQEPQDLASSPRFNIRAGSSGASRKFRTYPKRFTSL